jgi:nicotinic acid mononucleotide adenylyltransferase
MVDIVSEIHSCPWQGVIAITGCAPNLVTDLLAPGGGSATLLEAVVPYASKSLEQFIGRKPSNHGWKFCSAEVAAEMASAAFSRATELAPDPNSPEHGTPVFGLGITATLRKNGPEREGRIHQVFISFQTCNMAYNHHVIFDSKLSRLDEEHLVSRVALDVLSRHLLDKRHKVLLPTRTLIGNTQTFKPDDWWLVKESTEKQQFPEELQRLLDGAEGEDLVWDPKLGVLTPGLRTGRVVIPGSFNPFHEGHRSMVRAAKKHLALGDVKPILELSIANVDKGRLSGHEVLNRIQSFKHYQDRERDILFADLVVTDADNFVLKSFRFPNATFIIGVDTWYRLVDPKYYRHETRFMNECHAKIKENGCSFLVLGRFVNGSYHTLPTDKKTKGLAIGLSEEEFRVDISSTQLRSDKLPS